MKKVLLIGIMSFSFCVCSLMAQSGLTLATDIQSRYVWRGLALGGSSPSVQPSVTYSYKGLNVGAWGSFSLCNPQYQELDLSLSYNIKNIITFLVTDYDNPRYDKEFHYFNYDKDSTQHVFEGGVILNVPKTDISLGVYTNLYGNDKKKDNGDIVYSTYAEIKYKYEIKKLNTIMDFACGFALNGQDEGFYNNDGFSCVNLALGFTKQIAISNNLSLPIYTRLIANPNDNKLYLVCGTTITL
jgi:hypothetical protein